MAQTKYITGVTEEDKRIKFNVFMVRGSLRDLSTVDFSSMNIDCINLSVAAGSLPSRTRR